jgi:hypothetical protein
MMGILRRAITDKMKGDRPSSARAVLAAVVAGGVAAAITYKALRT